MNESFPQPENNEIEEQAIAEKAKESSISLEKIKQKARMLSICLASAFALLVADNNTLNAQTFVGGGGSVTIGGPRGGGVTIGGGGGPGGGNVGVQVGIPGQNQGGWGQGGMHQGGWGYGGMNQGGWGQPGWGGGMPGGFEIMAGQGYAVSKGSEQKYIPKRNWNNPQSSPSKGWIFNLQGPNGMITAFTDNWARGLQINNQIDRAARGDNSVQNMQDRTITLSAPEQILTPDGQILNVQKF